MLFTNRPLYGNPAAVVFDADDISAETMQKIAREMNLSETVFILEPTVPDADYRVCIFTPMNELPFAGHPTVAAAHSALARYPGKTDVTLLRQECSIGIVPVEVLPLVGGGKLLRMTQGAPSYRDTALSREVVAKMLGCGESDLVANPFEVVSTGVPWLIVELSRFEAISVLNPDQGLIAHECKELRVAGLTIFVVERGDGGPVRIRVRTFAPGEGVPEEPVCAGPATARSRPLLRATSNRAWHRAVTSLSKASRSGAMAKSMLLGNGTVTACVYGSAERPQWLQVGSCFFSCPRYTFEA